MRNGARAVEFAQKACELTAWKHPLFLTTLAAAYAEAGNFSEAVRWQEKVLADFPGMTKDDSEKLHARLDLYRQKRTYRQ
jgi:hypothetical protein